MNIRNEQPAFDALRPQAAEAEAFLKALANRHRLMILCELHKGERCVNALQQAAGLTQSALSQHLAKLRDENIVSTRRQAQTIFYSLTDPNVSRLIALLYEAFCSDECDNAEIPAPEILASEIPAPATPASAKSTKEKKQ
jgi:DNA-binding transcriptional ArsR family regulator